MSQRDPRPEAYWRCVNWLGGSLQAACMLESGTQRPLAPNGWGFKRPPAGAKSIGELHAEMCQVGNVRTLAAVPAR